MAESQSQSVTNRAAQAGQDTKGLAVGIDDSGYFGKAVIIDDHFQTFAGHVRANDCIRQAIGRATGAQGVVIVFRGNAQLY